MRNAAFANIDEYNRNTEKKLQRIIFACDEIAEVLDKTGLTKQQKDEILKNRIRTFSYSKTRQSLWNTPSTCNAKT